MGSDRVRVRVSVSFQQKYPPGSVLWQQKTGVITKGVVSVGDLTSSPAYNVEPVTNTSSSSCANNGHFATRTVDNTVDRYAFDTPVRGVPVRISPCRLVWKN